MTIQKIIETLLRSRLYRTEVSVEMDSGERHEGHVQDIQYDGSRSLVTLSMHDAVKSRVTLPLAHIARVGRKEATPGPKHGAAA